MVFMAHHQVNALANHLILQGLRRIHSPYRICYTLRFTH
ncbi:Hypothetical protein ABZS17H1_01585 [Kosakonia cowanii]